MAELRPERDEEQLRDPIVSVPGSVERRQPLQFPSPPRERVINFWAVGAWFLLVVLVLSAIAWWLVHPR